MFQNVFFLQTHVTTFFLLAGKNVFLLYQKKCLKMCKNVIQVYENVIQVYIFAHANKGVQNGGQCSAMYFNLYSTFLSAICYPFHFTWFLLLLSVSHCHSSLHIEMDLPTFQHILEERGLQSIAVRAQQHHADKWFSLLCNQWLM